MAEERRIETAHVLLSRDPIAGTLTDIRCVIEWSARNTGVAGLDDWRAMQTIESPIHLSDISDPAKQAALDAMNAAPLNPA